MSPACPLTPFAKLAPAVKLSLGLLAGLMVALLFILWPHWRQNPDLSHGYFMPVIFFVLLYESRAGPPRFLPAGLWTTAAFAVLLAGGLLALAAGGLYAASVGWSHDLVAFALTAAFVALLGAGLVVLSSASVRWLPCNWSAVVAIGLWLISAPIPPGTYSHLTFSLQLMVSENALRTLHLLGIAAVRQGNILELATTSVGIEEACSGVRSLISCVFAGFFFSATLVRRPWSRVLIILLSAPLALLMNFVRSVTLTLLANAGVSIAGAWHDFTGFAVLGVTAVLLAGLALLLERKAPPSADASVAPVPSASGRPGRAPVFLAGGLLVAAGLVVFFTLATRPRQGSDGPAPDLPAILPAKADGWHVETSTDLYQFSGTLQTENLAQRTYSRSTPRGTQFVILYVAYWRPGQASVSLVASHTPDACWPGAGWEPLPVPAPRVQLALGARTLAEAEYRSFRSGQLPQNVWFWHLYDGHVIAHQRPNTPVELLRLAWQYGFRREGEQLFVRVSGNCSWEDIRHEPFIAAFFNQLQPLGL